MNSAATSSHFSCSRNDDGTFDVCRARWVQSAFSWIAVKAHTVAPSYPHADAKEIASVLTDGSREQLISWLSQNDRNGSYSDADASADGWPPLTREEAVELMLEQIAG